MVWTWPKTLVSRIRPHSRKLIAAAFITLALSGYFLFRDEINALNASTESGIQTTRNGAMGLVDSNGRTLLAFRWRSCNPFDQNGISIVSLAPEQMQHAEALQRWGAVDRSGAIVVPVQYQKLYRVDDRYLAVDSGRIVELDSRGQVTARSDFHPLTPFSRNEKGPIPGRKGDLNGWFTLTGDLEVAAPDGLEPRSSFMHSGLALVTNAEGLYGAVDLEGKLAIAPEWQSIRTESSSEPESSALLLVMKNERYGLVDASGRILIPCEYVSLSVDSHRKLAIARLTEGKYGILNLQGTVVVPFEWELLAEFDDQNMCFAQRDDQVCWLNEAGTAVLQFDETIVPIDQRFDSLDMIRARRHDLEGWVDRKGEVRIDFQFTGCREFDSLDQAIVSKDGQFGLINRRGEIVVPIAFDYLQDCLPWSEWLLFGSNEKYGFMNRQGKVVVEPRFDQIPRIESNCAFVVTEAGFGVLGDDGSLPAHWSEYSLKPLKMETNYANPLLGMLAQSLNELQGKSPAGPAHSQQFFLTGSSDDDLHGLYRRGSGDVIQPAFRDIVLTDFGFRATGIRTGQESLEVLLDVEGREFWRSDQHDRDHMAGLTCGAIGLVLLVAGLVRVQREMRNGLNDQDAAF